MRLLGLVCAPAGQWRSASPPERDGGERCEACHTSEHVAGEKTSTLTVRVRRHRK